MSDLIILVYTGSVTIGIFKHNFIAIFQKGTEIGVYHCPIDHMEEDNLKMLYKAVENKKHIRPSEEFNRVFNNIL